MKSKKTDSNINKKDLFIKILLIVIIVILLIHNCCLLKNQDNKKVPTGNVDIIEINCSKEEDCFEDNTSVDNSSITDNVLDVSISKPELIIKDKNITWNGNTKAKIFTNYMYELNDVIAPESSNIYQFVIKNGTSYKLKYKINFFEKNKYGINMKYKLKKNNQYIIDHYVSYDELNTSSYLLNPNSNDTYYLEWKWISSDNDTNVGKNLDSKYELNIDVRAESVND